MMIEQKKTKKKTIIHKFWGFRTLLISTVVDKNKSLSEISVSFRTLLIST